MGALVLRDVEKAFDGKVACSGIDLSINEGEFFTFLGPSGCGKTTILRLIAGFIKPNKGSIHLGDRDITHLHAEKRNVGMVFQNYALFPFLTVSENIAYGLRIRKRPGREVRATVGKYMEMMGLIGFESRSVSDLSGGEQQRVALARSLANEPKVLLLDEPLSNLDARLRDRMRGEIKSLQKRLGITTVFVTHDQTEALSLSDRIAVFEKGRCIQVGTPEEIYAYPDSAFVARFIGDTNLFEAVITDGRAVIGGELSLRVTAHPGPGKYISIRPQDISLATVDPGHPNTLGGRLETSQLNGVWIEHGIRAKGAFFRVCVLNTRGHGRHIRPGSEVFITLPEECISVLDR